jgi:hypothetical protein
MAGDTQLLVMIGGVHLLALACVALLMLPALRDAEWSPGWRSDNDSDDGWGHGPKRPPSRPEPPSGGIPLPDAEQARVRLREPGRLADKLPRRERRPSREPERPPVRLPR